MRKFSFSPDQLRKAVIEAVAAMAPGSRVYELHLKVPVVEANKQPPVGAEQAPPRRAYGVDWQEEQRRMREEAEYVQQLGSGFAFMCSAQEKGAEPAPPVGGAEFDIEVPLKQLYVTMHPHWLDEQRNIPQWPSIATPLMNDSMNARRLREYELGDEHRRRRLRSYAIDSWRRRYEPLVRMWQTADDRGRRILSVCAGLMRPSTGTVFHSARHSGYVPPLVRIQTTDLGQGRTRTTISEIE